jgi:hypothetical protein
MREQSRPEPKMRHDLKGRWRHINGKVLTIMGSWDTREEAENWVRWNNFDEGLHGEIVPNPEL